MSLYSTLMITPAVGPDNVPVLGKKNAAAAGAAFVVDADLL